jgi:hypothetical protein
MIADLRARFEQFVRTLDGFEDIDVLLRGNDPPGKKRADYLFSDRTIIIEQKTLETDPNDKPQKYMDRLKAENRFIAWGTVPIGPGDKLHKTLIHKLTSVLETDVSHADKQTRDTREIFAIPNAVGMLVILNAGAQVLTPELIQYRLMDLFKADMRDGSVRYPHNDMIIVISELHPFYAGLIRYIPIRTYINSVTQHRERVVAFAKRLEAGWAAFNRSPLIRLDRTVPTF